MTRSSLFQTAIALLVSLSLVACTSMRPLPASDPQSMRAAVKVGDEVSVSAINGKTYLLTLTVVDQDKIIGLGDNKKVTIRYEQITALEVRRFSKGKTAGLAGGVVGALTVVAVVLVAVAFKGFGEALGQIFCFGLCEEDEEDEAAQN